MKSSPPNGASFCLELERLDRNYHGNPKPSFLGGITHILGCKTFIFHGFGVQG